MFLDCPLPIFANSLLENSLFKNIFFFLRVHFSHFPTLTFFNIDIFQHLMVKIFQQQEILVLVLFFLLASFCFRCLIWPIRSTKTTAVLIVESLGLFCSQSCQSRLWRFVSQRTREVVTANVPWSMERGESNFYVLFTRPTPILRG